MKTGIQTLGLVALTALGALLLGCSTPKADADSGPQQSAPRNIFRSTATPKEAKEAKEAKITAPVQLSFTSEPSAANASTAVLTLTVRAMTDIPSGVARIVLPSEIRLLSGEREMAFGALQKGEERQLSLTVEASARGRFQIFAGVDCAISSGIQLHKEARPIVLGQTPADSPN